MRRLAKISPVLVTFVVAAIALSACAVWKPGSFKAVQPEQVNDVQLSLTMCTKGDAFGDNTPCTPVSREFEEDGPNAAQQMVVFAVPSGSKAPDSFTSKPTTSGPSLEFVRNQEVADRFAAETFDGWPPAGHDLVGYLSKPYEEFKDMNLEWPMTAEFTIPAPGDGGAFGGPYNAWLATGFRYVTKTLAADRPIDCEESEGETTQCGVNEQLDLPVSDLRLAPVSPTVVGARGQTVSVPFALNFASSVPAPPNFALTASTALAGAKVEVGPTTYIPTGIDPGTHRAPPTTATVSIAIPAGVKPGTYDVSISAAVQPNGGKITATTSLTVKQVKGTIKFGKLTRNLKKGTAQLAVKVSGPGVLTLGGKKIQKVRKTAKAAGQIKVTIRAKGKAKKALADQGKAKVKASVVFTPTGGPAVKKNKPILLKKSS